MLTVSSKNGVPIRLPDDRWLHITEEHSEMAGYFFDVVETVQEPQVIYEGRAGELLATRAIETGKHLVVVYKEVSQGDGFVITAFLTSKTRQLQARTKVWPK